METALQRSLDRITKLRRLTRSSNKHEARAAFRQMRKLMEKVGVLYVADNDTVFLRLDETPPPTIIEPYLMQLAYVCATRWGCFAKRGAEGHLAVQGRRVSAEAALADYRDLEKTLANTCDFYTRGLLQGNSLLGENDNVFVRLRDLYQLHFYAEAVREITSRLLKPPKPKAQNEPISQPHSKIAESIDKDEALMRDLAATKDASRAQLVWSMAQAQARISAESATRQVKRRKAPAIYVKSPLKKVPLGLPAVGQSTVPVPQMMYVRDRMLLLEID